MSYQLIYPEWTVPEVIKGRQPWRLGLPIDRKWKGRKKRMLFVVDHVTSGDLKAERLLSSDTDSLFLNLIKSAWPHAERWNRKARRSQWAYGWVNFNYFKTYDLPPEQQALADQSSTERLRRLIKKLNPTHVHIFGPGPAQMLYDIPIEHSGWLLERDGRKVSSNLSVTSQSMRDVENEDSDEWDDYGDHGTARPNLLGHAADLLGRLFAGTWPHDLGHLEANYKLVDKLPKWKRLKARLLAAPYFAYDTETFNLTVHHNGLVTAQFTLPDEPTISYILPLKHRDSPWDAAQLEEIYRDLREIFARETDHNKWNTPYVIGQNLSFDWYVTRVDLAIPIIHLRCFDTMFGTYLSNENQKALDTKGVGAAKDVKNRPYALDNLLARYGNDFYFTNEFSKGDRAHIANMPLNPAVLRYMAMDTIAPMALHDSMLRQAAERNTLIENYRKTFKKLQLGVISDTIHVQSGMKQVGMQADYDHLTTQYAVETSDVIKERDRLTKELYAMPAVIEANRRLVEEMSLSSGGFLDGTEHATDTWVFNVNTSAHQHLLFFAVMELDNPYLTDSGQPSVGKLFLKFWGDNDKRETNHFREEVYKFASIMEAKKTLSFVKSYWEKLNEPDGQFDNRLRSSYGMVMVLTGRSNSFDPNLQNVPNHGRYAKIIKRAFAMLMGYLGIDMDFSAHEVRAWANMSGDTALANTFKKIWNLWVKYRKNPADPLFAEMDEKEGMPKVLVINDVHRVNYSNFTGVPVDKITKPQRQESKVIVFGVMFGKGLRSLAADIAQTVEYAQQVYDRFFGKFKKAKAWLDGTKALARKQLWVRDPLGFRRNLPGHLMANRSVSSALDRQAVNSPIQGYASRISYITIRLLMIRLYYAFKSENMYGDVVWNPEKGRLELTSKPAFDVCASVHDSTKTQTSYELAPLVAKAMEVCATTGLMEYLQRMYKVKFLVRTQVDFEIGDTGDAYQKWDYTKAGWKRVVGAAWKSHRARGNNLPRSEAVKALNPTPRVKRMMKLFHLDLSTYKDVE